MLGSSPFIISASLLISVHSLLFSEWSWVDAGSPLTKNPRATSGTSAICIPFQWITNKNTFFCYSFPLGQFQLKLFYCGKGRQNFASNITLYPFERSRQDHLVESRMNALKFGKVLVTRYVSRYHQRFSHLDFWDIRRYIPIAWESCLQKWGTTLIQIGTYPMNQGRGLHFIWSNYCVPKIKVILSPYGTDVRRKTHKYLMSHRILTKIVSLLLKTQQRTFPWHFAQICFPWVFHAFPEFWLFPRFSKMVWTLG